MTDLLMELRRSPDPADVRLAELLTTVRAASVRRPRAHLSLATFLAGQVSPTDRTEAGTSDLQAAGRAEQVVVVLSPPPPPAEGRGPFATATTSTLLAKLTLVVTTAVAAVAVAVAVAPGDEVVVRPSRPPSTSPARSVPTSSATSVPVSRDEPTAHADPRRVPAAARRLPAGRDELGLGPEPTAHARADRPEDQRATGSGAGVADDDRESGDDRSSEISDDAGEDSADEGVRGAGEPDDGEDTSSGER